MKVLVTGAAGRLGSRVARHLAEEGHEVVATDIASDDAAGVHGLDLTNVPSDVPLMAGVTAVVHCGAIPGPGAGTPAQILDANVGGTANLLRVCLEHEVRKLVFASSIQVLASERGPDQGAPEVSYLPLDGDSPSRPVNVYAFSKAAGETMIEALFATPERECQSLRFPWLVEPTLGAPWGRSLESDGERPSSWLVEQAFTFLSFDDAARLVVACLEATLPGYRVYLPALSAVPSERIAEYVDRLYRGVPLKRPLEELTSLVDLEPIRADTGWFPRDIPPPAPPRPPAGWFRRFLRGT